MNFFRSIRGKLLSAVIAVTTLLAILVCVQLVRMNAAKSDFGKEAESIRNTYNLLLAIDKKLDFWLFDNLIAGFSKREDAQESILLQRDIEFHIDSLIYINQQSEAQITAHASRFRSTADSLFIDARSFRKSLNSSSYNFDITQYPDYSDSSILNSGLVNWLELQFGRASDISTETYNSIVELEKRIKANERAFEEFSAALVKAQKEKEAQLTSTLNWISYATLIIVIAVILLLLTGGHFLYQNIITSVGKANEELETLSRGSLLEKKMDSPDEIGAILHKVHSLSENLSRVKDFADEVGSGDFDSDVQVFDNKGEIGESLAGMRESLKEVSEQTKIRNWANEGIAEFSTLIRKNQDDLEQLADEALSYLVKYLEANQGAIFTLEGEGEEQKMIMQSCYAYKRKKFIDKEISLGQGLVGQAWYERDSIYLTEVPEDYIDIGSGLGDAKPNCVLVMPMISNDEVLGVIELASFRQFKEYEIGFVKNISESIASALATVKVSQNTKSLLDESRQMTEEMQAQEEEMRQNMEELEATQEEVARKNEETECLLNESERKSESLNVLLNLSSRITTETSTKSACENTLTDVCEYTKWSIGHIYILNRETSLLEPSGFWNSRAKKRFSSFVESTRDLEFTKGDGLPGKVFESEKAQWIEDIMAEQSFPRSKEADNAGLKSAFAFPIVGKGKFMGVMEFFSEEMDSPNPSLLELMNQVGSLLGNAFETLERSGDLTEKLLNFEDEKKKLDISRKEVVSILDGIQEFIFVFDKELVIQDINSQAEKVLGQDKSVVEQTSAKKYLPEIDDVLSKELPFRGRTTLASENKSLNIEVLINTIRKENENLFLLTGRDVLDEPVNETKGIEHSASERNTKRALLKMQKSLKNLS